MAHVERELRAARILAGTVPLVGPGVSVTISDGKMDEVAMAQFITHDWDLRSVVNELFAAGADAVSINSARVTETTGIFCVGPVVRVGTMQIGPPFIIRAIGQSGVLSAALNLPGGPLDILRGANRGLSVSNPIQEKMISIPAYQTPLVITGVVHRETIITCCYSWCDLIFRSHGGIRCTCRSSFCKRNV